MHKIIISAILLSVCGGVWAQPTPAQIQMQQHWQQQNMYGAIQSDNLKRCGDVHGHGCRQQRVPRGPSEAEIRAWERREAKIQAKIAKYRATPYYGAISFGFRTNSLGWTGGYESKQRAIEKKKQGCSSSDCEIVKVFSNACAVLVMPMSGVKSRDDLFFGVDKDDRVAAAKALQACESQKGKGNCGFSAVKTHSGTAFCTGYDYSVYGQK